jgi:drug/metabolite transporter (DMT)-like permease
MTLGETLGAREIAGLVITVVGVAAATRGSRPQEELEPV